LLDQLDIIYELLVISGVDSASNRNEYQEYFLEGKLAESFSFYRQINARVVSYLRIICSVI